MGKPRYDGVIEAVRYKPDGQIAWVRAYERRGPTFSDRVLIDRRELIERLKAGKVFVVGKRLPLLASTFETYYRVRLASVDGQEILTTSGASWNAASSGIVTSGSASRRDHLEGAPLV